MNKNTYKILVYVAKHDKTKPYYKTINRFKKHQNPSAENSVFMLNTDKMIAIEYSYDKNNNPVDPITLTITPKGKEHIERCKSQKFADKFARIMSIIAILISLLSLIVSILKGG